MGLVSAEFFYSAGHNFTGACSFYFWVSLSWSFFRHSMYIKPSPERRQPTAHGSSEFSQYIILCTSVPAKASQSLCSILYVKHYYASTRAQFNILYR